MTEAFHSIPKNANRGLFIFGDHSSKHIPAEYNNLGLESDDLLRHIAWDIGTETIVRQLCAHFGCAGHLAAVSRLVVDYNRDPASPSIIPVVTDGTVVPGNQALSEAQKRARIDGFHGRYHQALSRAIDALETPFVMSIHSFTPQPKEGGARLTDIGLLVKDDEESAAHLRQNFMRLERDFLVEINQPYSAYDLNYTIDRHVGPRRLRHLAIEIRQDHIETEEKAKDIAAVLADRLTPIIDGTFTPLPA